MKRRELDWSARVEQIVTVMLPVLGYVCSRCGTIYSEEVESCYRCNTTYCGEEEEQCVDK